MKKQLAKSKMGSSLFGVCAGIANYFQLPPILIRLLFIIFIPFSVLIYLFLNYWLPEDN